jgi:hypothetical protein
MDWKWAKGGKAWGAGEGGEGDRTIWVDEGKTCVGREEKNIRGKKEGEKEGREQWRRKEK